MLTRATQMHLPLLLGNVAIFVAFVVGTPLFFAGKSACEDFGFYNPLGCEAILSSAVLTALILNHAFNAFADANIVRPYWRGLGPALAFLPAAATLLR